MNRRKTMSNYMVDLETMGSGSSAAIVAIGAVEFGAKGVGKEFYEVIDLNTSVSAGLEIDPDTLMWWMGQSDEARKALTVKGKVSLFDALMSFKKFIGAKKSAKIWGNGASFDNPILANAYRAVNLEQPWHFWNDRCYRTIKKMLGAGIEMERVGDHHNALDDAKSQAAHLVKIMTVITASKAA
jgi:hypothetical protein